MAVRIEHTFTADQPAGFVVNAPSGQRFTATTEVFFCGILLDDTDYTQTEQAITFSISFLSGDDIEIILDADIAPGDIDITISPEQTSVAVQDDSTAVEVQSDDLSVSVAPEETTVAVSNPRVATVTVSAPDSAVAVQAENINVSVADAGVQGAPGRGIADTQARTDIANLSQQVTTVNANVTNLTTQVNNVVMRLNIPFITTQDQFTMVQAGRQAGDIAIATAGFQYVDSNGDNDRAPDGFIYFDGTAWVN